MNRVCAVFFSMEDQTIYKHISIGIENLCCLADTLFISILTLFMNVLPPYLREAHTAHNHSSFKTPMCVHTVNRRSNTTPVPHTHCTLTGLTICLAAYESVIRMHIASMLSGCVHVSKVFGVCSNTFT